MHRRQHPLDDLCVAEQRPHGSDRCCVDIAIGCALSVVEIAQVLLEVTHHSALNDHRAAGEAVQPRTLRRAANLDAAANQTIVAAMTLVIALAGRRIDAATVSAHWVVEQLTHGAQHGVESVRFREEVQLHARDAFRQHDLIEIAGHEQHPETWPLRGEPLRDLSPA